MDFLLNIIKICFTQFILLSNSIFSQCDFQPGNPAGGTETVCFYDASDVLLGCSYNCQVTGQQIKCGYSEASIPYPTYYKVTFTSLICYNAAVLPIELVYFSINRTKENNAYECSWSTQSEKNNNYFELEKSTDGIHFNTITEIKGVGTTNQLNTYKFIDKNIYPLTSYYRLKQIDFDGNFKYFTTLSIEYIPTYNVELKHNPSNNNLLKLSSKHEIKEINIISSTGKRIPCKNVDEYIDVEKIEAGLMFIETILDNNVHVYTKYIKK